MQPLLSPCRGNMFIRASQDAEYRKWWQSPKMRISRMLDNLIGFRCTLQLLSTPITTTIMFGLLHSRPKFVFELGWVKPEDKLVILGITYSCSYNCLEVFNKQWKALWPCKECKFEVRKAKQARANIVRYMVGDEQAEELLKGFEDEEDDDAPKVRQPVPPAPENDGAGALMEWL